MSEDSDLVQQAELAAALRRRSSEITRELVAAGRKVRSAQTAVEEARQAVAVRLDDQAAAVEAYRVLRDQAATWLPAAELELVAPQIRVPRRR